MDTSIKATVVPISPEKTVSLSEAFKAGAAGPPLRQDISFDGKASPSDTTQKVAQVIDAERLAEAVAKVNSYVQSLSRSLAITVDERSGDVIVRVQDANTEEVIRQIPSEEVLAISNAISQQLASLKVMGEEGARGLLLEAVT
jgi:flagellar protein FlaG